MSDSEEEIFGFYGKPLEQYDEDAIPKKRPISVEEQIATDTQGRRRFHGAFTGGFSAGFFNTVGSLEGWKPSEFKSSRSEKTANKVQKPEDYMDDEDMGEFGIAPQIVKATDDFNTSKKRKRKTFPDGPIPGEPVLQTLIDKNTETIGYILLRNMGLRHTSDNNAENDNMIVNDNDDMAPKKVYGCEMPKPQEIKMTVETFKINEIYEQALKSPKINTFGMGYKGLDKGNINLFQSSKLVVQDRNKKFSVSGQAFGVGAFEEEDEDIYVKEDLSKYDFELSSEKHVVQKKVETNLFLKLFVASKNTLTLTKKFLPPTIPHSFSGKYKVRKSRFEPIEPIVEPKRHEIDASTRSEALGELTAGKTYTASKQLNKRDNLQISKNNSNNNQINETKFIKSDGEVSLNSTNLLVDKFVSASSSGDHLDILEPVRLLGTTHGSKDMKEAARMKMFGPLTRISTTWLPNSLLCKRFNVPEPGYNESEMKPRTKTKPLIFESEKFASEVLNDRSPGIEIKKTVSEVAPEHLMVNQETTIEKETEQSEPQVTEVNRATIDITEKIDVSKNIDLFKAVFFDSDSEIENNDNKEENELNIKEDSQRAESIKSKVLSEELFLPKIKPIKEGILSNVKFNEYNKANENESDNSVQVVAEEQEIESENDKDPNTFGPKLPDKILNKVSISAIRPEKQNDEWIEKCDVNKIKEHKHKSKRKKEKHKKKHKHKR